MGEASLINTLWFSLLFANFMAGNLSPDAIYAEIAQQCPLVLEICVVMIIQKTNGFNGFNICIRRRIIQ